LPDGRSGQGLQLLFTFQITIFAMRMRIGSIMKRFLLPILCLAVAAGCSSRGDRTQEQLDEFAPIQIGSSFVSGISDNGREVLNYFRLASGEVDNIYWDQNFGDKSKLNSLPRIQREFADVNYGPWSRIDGQTFVPGWKQERARSKRFPGPICPLTNFLHQFHGEEKRV